MNRRIQALAKSVQTRSLNQKAVEHYSHLLSRYASRIESHRRWERSARQCRSRRKTHAIYLRPLAAWQDHQDWRIRARSVEERFSLFLTLVLEQNLAFVTEQHV